MNLFGWACQASLAGVVILLEHGHESQFSNLISSLDSGKGCELGKQ